MAKRYTKFYNPDRQPKTKGYFNQGFSGTWESEAELPEDLQQARLDKRAADYERWQRIKRKIPAEQLKNAKKREDEKNEAQIGSVSSSWLTSLGYNMESSEAVATFYGTNQVFFYEMPYKKYLEWLNSPSKGKWLHDHKSIMQNYRTEGSANKSFQKQLSRKGKKYLAKWR